MTQLQQVLMLVAWLYSVLGVPQPSLVGRIVVPFRELATAERLLRGSRSTRKVKLPAKHGDITISYVVDGV
jgi:hypothetical protein